MQADLSSLWILRIYSLGFMSSRNTLWTIKTPSMNDVPIAMQSEANMHDEMYGHLLAAMRFGADEASCRAAIDIAFRCPASALICFIIRL
jgi:hypothetical protein